jgi:hypothetical protein
MLLKLKTKARCGVHAYNPSYMRGWRKEDHGQRLALGKSWRPYLKKIN